MRSRCAACNGTGRQRTQRRSILGTLISESTCTVCSGAGEVVDQPCASCRGEGRHRVDETIEINVPPGVERGDSLVARGKGEGGIKGGPNGDLYVHVDVEPHEKFAREGTNLAMYVEVGMVDAALGTTLEIEGIDSPHELRIKSGTQPGEILRLKGKGLPSKGGGRRGDMIVRVDVAVPRKLSGEQKKLLEKLRSSGKDKAGG